MNYGYFDDIRKEYVITRPDTPLPWINYLGNADYVGLISNTAGGYSFYKDARLRRITRYRYNNVPLDFGGRYLYIRNQETGDYWTPTWQPVRKWVENYSCRHGLGYTVISSTTNGVESQIQYYVPLNQNLEIWNLTLTNHTLKPVPLQIYSVVEFALWDAYDDATNFQRNFNTAEVEVENGVIYHKTEYRERRDHFAYFACSAEVDGFETQRDAFLGAYRGWDCPYAVETGKLSNSIVHGWAPIGSHLVNLEVQPGKPEEIIFLLGYQENTTVPKFNPPSSIKLNKQLVIPILEKFLNQEHVETSLGELKKYWENKTQILQVDTPDEHTNRMVNIWNAYQCMTTFNLSRSASYFESGIGRGMGFRDSNQDLLGMLHMIPDRARERILDLAATQFEDGGAYHQYQPLTRRGNDAVGSDFNDDPLWLVLSTGAYLKETADWSILEEPVPFENKPGTERSLFDHLQRSIQYTLDRLGPHNLPLIGRADWNDCLNLNTFSETPGESFQTTTSRDGTVAESIFIAGLFVLASKEMADISARYGRKEDSLKYLEAAAQMELDILESGWDGKWYLRAYDALGNKVGSSSCEEGQIFIEPQGICGMAGIGLDEGYSGKALDSVHSLLATEHGIVLHQPAYSRYYLHLGEISSYPPGYKENAGIFCHTNPWIMIAETIIGNFDRAFDYYLRINPSYREEISEIHRCEPYVYAQMIAGRDAPTHGEAKNSWLTGTAAWNYVAITQWILGIHPTYDGLSITPAMPSKWKGFTARRFFRGIEYAIQVTRKGNGNEISLIVNGNPIEGHVISTPEDGTKFIQVNVVVG